MKKVKVYFNLHKKCLSIQHMTENGWRVREHKDSIHLKNVKFSVSQKGRERVIKEQRKNVHAYIMGEEINDPPHVLENKVRYNPYTTKYFMKNEDPIFESDYCSIVNRTVMV